MKTRLLLIRHGRVHNPRKVFYGRLPRFGLSDRGRQEAGCTARALQGKPLDALYSSPLLRARQTARAILALQPQLRLQTSALLNEVYTPYQGLATREVDALDGDVYTGCGPPFEQPQDVLARVQTFARRVRRLHAGGRVAAVTHGDAITFMVLWAGNLAVIPDNKRRLQLAGIHDGYPATASVTTLTYRSDRPEERPTVTYRKAC